MKTIYQITNSAKYITPIDRFILRAQKRHDKNLKLSKAQLIMLYVFDNRKIDTYKRMYGKLRELSGNAIENIVGKINGRINFQPEKLEDIIYNNL